jgi:hypothetical protein
MILLAANQCEEPTCNKTASFGQPDTKVSDAWIVSAAFF